MPGHVRSFLQRSPPKAQAAANGDELYRLRIARLYVVVIVYGLVVLAIDLAQAPLLAWGGRVHWPRLAALLVVGPIALAGIRRWVSPFFLRLTEPLVYVTVIGEVTAELILSKSPVFLGDQPAVVLLFLRASYVPSRPRAQLFQGCVVTAALGAGAFAYMHFLGRDLTPIFAELAPGNVELQVANVLLGGGVIAGITTYVAASIEALRREAEGAKQLGQYVLDEVIGEGGMGQVWRARHAILQRPTAVKVIRGDVNPNLTARFEREVKVASQLTHASSVAVYDFGVTADGRVFYAMELLRGLTLEAIVSRFGPMPPERVVHLLVHVLGALEEAHLLGLVHRDVKPANIMVTKNGAEHDFPKLFDYGLVHLKKRSPDAPSLTRGGALTGTPLYMAPELITGDLAPDGRTDLYSLGAVGYFLLTGEAPFTGPNATQVMLSHIKTKPVPPSARSEIEVPEDVEAVLLRALEKAPAARFSTAGEMRDALRACRCFGTWNEARAGAWWRAHAPGDLE
ncbi:MAG: serine/threonine protein kinase [Polyangiaceae bacterium]|nr:serine/threonine protein kinase [Polyangiaceae bacterium]